MVAAGLTPGVQTVDRLHVSFKFLHRYGNMEAFLNFNHIGSLFGLISSFPFCRHFTQGLIDGYIIDAVHSILNESIHLIGRHSTVQLRSPPHI